LEIQQLIFIFLHGVYRLVPSVEFSPYYLRLNA